jgi:hypothetical protein
MEVVLVIMLSAASFLAIASILAATSKEPEDDKKDGEE